MIDDTSLDVYVLDLGIPLSFAEERVYSLTLDYVNAQNEVIETYRAELGSVQGVNGAVARCVNCEPTDRAWLRYKSSCAVLPIPADATSLAVDGGSAVAADGPGWKQFDQSGVHALEMSVGDESWLAEFNLGIPGLMMIFR